MLREIERKVAYENSRPHVLFTTENVEDPSLKAYLRSLVPV